MAPKILYITSSKLAGMMNAERWGLIRAFKKAGHTIVDVETDNVYGRSLPKLIKSFDKEFGLIIFEEMSWAIKHDFNIFFKDCHKIDIPKATFISDYWLYTERFRKLLKHNDIRTFLTCHENSYRFIGRYFGDLIDKIVWIPLTIDLEEFNFLSQKKEIDFFLSGALTPITPFRGRVIELLKTKRKKYAIYHLEHPGQWRKGENRGIHGQEYYKLLAQSHFCLSTTGIYNISARKYWEITAAGSTIFGNQTGHPEHFLIQNNLVEIRPEMSDNEILKIIDKAYEKKEEWNKKAKISQNIVKDFVSTDHTVRRIEDWICRLRLPIARPESILERTKNKIHSLIYYKLLKKSS